MGMTPNSSATPYATVADFFNRQDVNLLGQLAIDDGTVATVAEMSDPTTTPGKNVLAALMDASGEIESLATRGGRYQPTDLQNLTGNSAAFLKRIVCDMAAMNMWDRRDGQDPPQNVVEKYKRAQEFMNDLRNGLLVFGDLQAQQAGPAKSTFFTNADRIQNNQISAVWSRWSGTRSADRPTISLSGRGNL